MLNSQLSDELQAKVREISYSFVGMTLNEIKLIIKGLQDHFEKIAHNQSAESSVS